MTAMVLTKIDSKYLAVGLASISLFPAASLGADVGGGIRIGASHTDNVFLAPDSERVDAVVYQASPSLTFMHESPQLDASLEYAYEWYRYSDLSTTSEYHRGEAIVSGRAFGESLTTEFGARRSQVLRDPTEAIPRGRLPLTDNLVDQDEWWLNPQLTRSIGGAVMLDADYRFSKIQFGDSTIQDNENQVAAFSLDNYAAGRGVTWALRYDWRRSSYVVSLPWENQRASVELGFYANARARIFGVGGKESSWENVFEPELEDTFWETGFAYSPNDRLSAEFAVGERSFGASWRGRIDYSFSRGSTSLSYNESPTTTSFDSSLRFVSVLEQNTFDEFLDEPGRAERFISERFDWDLTLEFRRSTFNLAVFDEKRTNRFTAVGTPAEDQSQSGVTAEFTWQAAARTEFSILGWISSRETFEGNESEFSAAALNINYRLGARTSLSLAYSYSEEQAQGLSPTVQDWRANVVSLFFIYSI